MYTLKDTEEMASKVTEQTHCSKHKQIRLKTLYARGTRKEGQPFRVAGKVCPICKDIDVDYSVVFGAE